MASARRSVIRAVEGRSFPVAQAQARIRERKPFWLQQGVSGAPFVVVNYSYAIEGAQPPEAFEQAFRQVALSR